MVKFKEVFNAVRNSFFSQEIHLLITEVPRVVSMRWHYSLISSIGLHKPQTSNANDWVKFGHHGHNLILQKFFQQSSNTCSFIKLKVINRTQYTYTHRYMYLLYIYIYLFYFTKKNLKRKRNMDLRPLYIFTSNDLGNN